MKAKSKVYKISIPSNISKIIEVEQFSEKIADLANFSEEDKDNLAIAVTEAVNNAIIHGNRYNESKKVFVTFYIIDRGVKVSVKDEGGGFDPDKIDNPLLPENLLKEHGRGIFILKSLMDEIEFKFSNTGTEILMTKYKTV
ncbi:ATP-binding protein [candidate division KSB1 bacterium]|nr:MAG: ATP-binding protein [candidate division KSB1 bacterium]